jgi:hypothetical protein
MIYKTLSTIVNILLDAVFYRTTYCVHKGEIIKLEYSDKNYFGDLITLKLTYKCFEEVKDKFSFPFPLSGVYLTYTEELLFNTFKEAEKYIREEDIKDIIE